MKNKGLLVVGVIVLAGIGYYIWSTKRSGESSTGEGTAGDLGTDMATKSANAPLQTRKDKRKACGRKPLLNKEKKAQWEQCVASGGVASFDGDNYGL
jgi:hypothetical protein